MNHSRSILRTSPICFGATKNFTVLSSSASGVRLIRSTNALDDVSYVAITSPSVSGAFGIFPNSIPPSSACSLAFCSVTNIQARSFAALHLACGFRSDLAAGYALSTRIVVDSSFSSWVRNCCFALMIFLPFSAALDETGELLEAPGPSGLMLLLRLFRREQLLREHELGRVTAVQELDGHHGFWGLRLALPPPGIHQLSRGVHDAVDTDQAVQRAVGCLHVDAVRAPGPQVHLCDGRGERPRGLPLFHFVRRGPRPEDALRPARERAPEPERDGGPLLLSGGHADDSCALGWAR